MTFEDFNYDELIEQRDNLLKLVDTLNAIIKEGTTNTYDNTLSVVIDTFNGAGYSDVETITCKTHMEVLHAIDLHLASYSSEDLDNLTKNDEFDFTIPVAKDHGRVQVLALPNNFNIIEVKPCTNEAKLIAHFDEECDVLKELEILLVGTKYSFEDDDITDWLQNTDDKFGSHSNDGDFIFLKIIKN